MEAIFFKTLQEATFHNTILPIGVQITQNNNEVGFAMKTVTSLPLPGGKPSPPQIDHSEGRTWRGCS